jgi:mono/diheme cytochrome c family protein
MPDVNRFWILVFIMVGLGGVAHALDAEQQHGKALLEKLCARCHAVGASGRSPHPQAPPFRSFGETKLYDEDFGQRLQDGLFTIHQDMPTFHFSRDDAAAALNYLKDLRERAKSK